MSECGPGCDCVEQKQRDTDAESLGFRSNQARSQFNRKIRRAMRPKHETLTEMMARLARARNG